jgi:hypothetical protein
MFNPATQWFQWMLDQMDEYTDGPAAGSLPKLSLRMMLVGQLEALKSYRKMTASIGGDTMNAMNNAYHAMAEAMWKANVSAWKAAATSAQPAAIKAHDDMLAALIERMEQELARFDRGGDDEEAGAAAAANPRPKQKSPKH